MDLENVILMDDKSRICVPALGILNISYEKRCSIWHRDGTGHYVINGMDGGCEFSDTNIWDPSKAQFKSYKPSTRFLTLSFFRNLRE